MGDQMPVYLRLDTVLQLLSHHGYSVSTLIDDILARGGSEWEDERIKLLREGIERDAVDICARLLRHHPASTSISQWALGIAQSTLRSEVEEIPRREHDLRNVVSPNLSSGTACASINGPDRAFGTQLIKFNYGHKVTVNILPDNVLLEIFSFYLRDSDPEQYFYLKHTRRWQPWQTLAHICQRWRRIIFASPRRLKLHLTCSYGTPVRKNLALWPVILPLILNYHIYHFRLGDKDNMVFALEHARRVHLIDILVMNTMLGQVFTAMQRSFPLLTDLELRWTTSNFSKDFSIPFPFIPGRFLGGSAPRLQHLRLHEISFPQFPTFLWSAPNLVTLKLKDIHYINHISPEAMVRGLAVLTKLRYFSFSFCDETTPSDQWRSHPDPPLRTILPALVHFHYRGCGDYLEDLLAQIDTPRLEHFSIKYVTRQMQVPQLSQLIGHTENLNINQFRRARITFCYDYIRFELDWSQGESYEPLICLKFMEHEELYMQVPHLVHVLSQLVTKFSQVDHLVVTGYWISSREMDLTEWLPFFRLFPAVGTLKLSRGVPAYIVSALEDTADPENSEMVADIFPALYSLTLERSDEEEEEDDTVLDRDKPVGSIERFLSSRQLSGRPVTVFHTRYRDEVFRANQNPQYDDTP